ncbi:hypothetical protein JW964_17155 [candidate division KSB1 bacterium]|nr:hypothetical protein [candidate division KSB1 bacterium]
MEFILYRLIQLSKRELQIIDEILGFLLSNSRIMSNESEPTNPAIISKERFYAYEFSQIRKDKNDECNTLAKLLKISYHDKSFVKFLNEVNNAFENNYLASALCNDLLMINEVATAKNRMIQKYFNLDCSRFHHRLFQSNAFDELYLTRMGEWNWSYDEERLKIVN